MKKKIGFIAIGDTIEFDGVKAVAVAARDTLSCKGCVFCDGDECPCTRHLTECYYTNRKDHKNIAFEMVD